MSSEETVAAKILEAIHAIAAREAVHFLIARRADQAAIGYVHVARVLGSPHRGDLSYWIGEDYQGYATEAVVAAVGAALESLDLVSVEAGAHVCCTHPLLLDKLGKMMGASYDWSADVKKLAMPVMLVFADNDSVSQQHIAEFFALLGGGVKEPGWQNTQLSKARLAIVPGYSHYNFVSATELASIIDKYLADPLTNPPTGAAAASQAAPELTKSN